MSLAVARVGGSVSCDLGFVAVADRKQHVLGVVQIAALLAVVLKYVGLNDRVDWAGFFAEAAENAFGEINVVACGAACAVVALL